MKTRMIWQRIFCFFGHHEPEPVHLDHPIESWREVKWCRHCGRNLR